MPNCIVTGCNSYRPSPSKRKFRLPSVIHHSDDATKRLSQKRRKLWLKRIGLTENEVNGDIRVCEHHFVEGKPSYYMNQSSVDWAPSVAVPGFSGQPLKYHVREQRRKSYAQRREKFLAQQVICKNLTKSSNEVEPLNTNPLYIDYHRRITNVKEDGGEHEFQPKDSTDEPISTNASQEATLSCNDNEIASTTTILPSEIELRKRVHDLELELAEAKKELHLLQTKHTVVLEKQAISES